MQIFPLRTLVARKENFLKNHVSLTYRNRPMSIASLKTKSKRFCTADFDCHFSPLTLLFSETIGIRGGLQRVIRRKKKKKKKKKISKIHLIACHDDFSAKGFAKRYPLILGHGHTIYTHIVKCNFYTLHLLSNIVSKNRV